MSRVFGVPFCLFYTTVIRCDAALACKKMSNLKTKSSCLDNIKSTRRLSRSPPFPCLQPWFDRYKPPFEICCGLHSNVGASRGFAFVEFAALEDAVRWMEAKQVMRVIHPAGRDRGRLGMSEREGDRLVKMRLLRGGRTPASFSSLICDQIQPPEYK